MVRSPRLESPEIVTCLLFYPDSVSEGGHQSFFLKTPTGNVLPTFRVCQKGLKRLDNVKAPEPTVYSAHRVASVDPIKPL
jgi:hypothetical protein